jgi:hypothetical protein
MHNKDKPKDGRTSGYDVEIAETICQHFPASADKKP